MAPSAIVPSKVLGRYTPRVIGVAAHVAVIETWLGTRRDIAPLLDRMGTWSRAMSAAHQFIVNSKR